MYSRIVDSWRLPVRIPTRGTLSRYHHRPFIRSCAYHMQQVLDQRRSSGDPRGLGSADRHRANVPRPRHYPRHGVRSDQPILVPRLPPLLLERAAQHVCAMSRRLNLPKQRQTRVIQSAELSRFRRPGVSRFAEITRHYRYVKSDRSLVKSRDITR